MGVPKRSKGFCQNQPIFGTLSCCSKICTKKMTFSKSSIVANKHGFSTKIFANVWLFKYSEKVFQMIQLIQKLI